MDENPSFAFIGKLCIAAELIKAKYVPPDLHNGSQVKRNRTWTNHKDNWYKHLINHIRRDARDASQLESQTQLSFITYNYDTTLEEFISEQFSNTEKHHGARHENCIKTMHIHGALEGCVEGSISFVDLLLQSIDDLTTVGEGLLKKSAKIQANRKRAVAALKGAEHVYIVGFGFHPFNIELIELDKLPNKKSVFILNYDDNDRINRLANQLSVPTKNVIRKKSICDLFEVDIFSDRPLGHSFY